MSEPLQIGKGFHLKVYWYDHVPEPQRSQVYDGEVIAWRNSQLIIRVKDYAVLRFRKKDGLEVGNPDWERRGFRLELSELARSADGTQALPIQTDFSAPPAPPPGISINIEA